MAVHLEITDRGGQREQVVEDELFWIGSTKAGECAVRVDLGGDFEGRVLEVEEGPTGRIRLRAEAGLPFPIRCVTGNVGTRFEPIIDGDVLNVGPAMIKVRQVSVGDDAAGSREELDPAQLAGVPGAPVGHWYEIFMGVADQLEGLRSPEKMIHAALDAVLQGTGAERASLQLDPEHAVAERDGFYRARGGSSAPFRVSKSMVEQVRSSRRAVHVPAAQADPVASRFQSVRSEGISAGICLPVEGLGKTIGVLYADCVSEGATLTAEDLQRIAFLVRLLASSLGNQTLVSSLLSSGDGVRSGGKEHWALESRSPACAEVVQRVKLYAPADYTVLLRGETGTGKEVIARAIHDLSRRSKGPFVPVNSAAIPEQLMESMLFGHEKGAFTGATQARRGHFEEAHGGTIFLDEIGDMALDLQAKILRVLQDRVVTPVGGRKQVKVDVRILAATHQDLEKMVREGALREDLYYRLRELEILLPPLRARLEDLEMLCARFLEEAAQDLGFRSVPEVDGDALEALARNPWRGNIRELRHIVKGAALRAHGGPIRREHLDLRNPLTDGEGGGNADMGGDAGGTWKERLEAQERRALQRTLDEAEGNLTKAAELFGVPRTTYREKLVRHGLLQG